MVDVRPLVNNENNANSIPLQGDDYTERYDRLRSTFPDEDDYLRQAEDPINSRTKIPSVDSGGLRTYFQGGVRSLTNVCTFSAPNVSTLSGGDFPPRITLYLSPNDVSWKYSLRTNVIDTYGGQVVQILGVSIEDLTIRGFFGEEGMWGYNENHVSRYEEFPDELMVGEVGYAVSNNQEYKKWKQTDVKNDRYAFYRNGMVQFSEWFKTYFYYTTQAGNFDKNNMTFHYPHLNWHWNIRPLDFPRVRFANDELTPQWELKCDFIEDIQNNFQQEVTAVAKKALGRFRDNVGFSEFIEWSEPVYTNKQSRTDAAKDIAVKYSDFIGGDFTEKELETLLTRGFSYPVDALTPHQAPRGGNVPPPEGDGSQRTPPNAEEAG